MNSNQKLQVEKIAKIVKVSSELQQKVKTLEAQISANGEKVRKIENFLQKQGISPEEIHSSVKELITQFNTSNSFNR